MRNGIAQVRQQLMVADGVATEETMAGFISTASVKEIAVLNETGTAVPTAGETFFITYKDSNGTLVKSNWITPKAIKSVRKVAASVAIPTYSYFAVDVTSKAAKDVLEILTRVYGFQTGALPDRLSFTTGVVMESGDTTDTMGVKAGIAVSKQLAYAYESYPESTVYNKAGYVAIYETEALALADVGNLTDTNLVWVIANSKPYTFAASGASFASNFTEKTDWATQIAATTAVAIPKSRYFDVVQLDADPVVIYVICKALVQDDERKLGTESPVYVGVQWLDESADYVKTDVGVTRVAEQPSAGDGKQIRNMEVSLDKLHRFGGRFDKLGETPVLNSVKTDNYSVVTIQYLISDYGNHTLGVEKANWHTLFIAFNDSTKATNFYNTMLTIASAVPAHNLEDHTNVTLTNIADDEVFAAVVTEGTGAIEWVNAADATS
jgi:hypothetical protein